MNTDFAHRVRDWLDEEQVVREGLAYEGKQLVAALCGIHGSMSLRSLARQSGLSPTYLSRVLNGWSNISPDAYLTLHKIATSLEKEHAVQQSKSH